MKISRELAIKILKYLNENPDFYFPFLVTWKECKKEDDDFIEIEPNEWGIIQKDEKYQTFELWENLQNLDKETLKLLAKGFLEKIIENSLERKIQELVKKYRGEWREELWESENIEEFGYNEFIGGKMEGCEECLDLIKKYKSSF